MRRALRQPPIDRALAALRPICCQPAPAPAPEPAQEWQLAGPAFEGTVGPDVLQWRPSCVERLEEALRPAPGLRTNPVWRQIAAKQRAYDGPLRIYSHGRFVGEDDKGVLIVDTDGKKALS